MKDYTSIFLGVVGIILFFIGLFQINPFLFFGALFYFIAWLLDQS